MNMSSRNLIFSFLVLLSIFLLTSVSAITITQTTTPPSITNNRSEIIAYNISTDNMQDREFLEILT